MNTQLATPAGELLEGTRVKGQTVRAADVFVIGPVMVLGGVKLFREHPILGGTLVLLGISTVAYNARNWWLVDKALGRPGRIT